MSTAMEQRPIDQHDSLDDFTRETFTRGGRARPVYRIGTGPAVIVIHEIPGLTPGVANFARRVAAYGMTAVCPVLVGEPGRPTSNAYTVASIARICISREFNLFAAGESSPVTLWLGPLARDAHARSGGPGVGVVGMCFSGGFALAMSVDPVVIAPVLSQPSTPARLPWKKGNTAALDCSAAELATVKARFDAEPDLCFRGYRFTNDGLVRKERFARLQSELGDRFHGVCINSAPDNPGGYPANAHSVLAHHLVESAAVEVVDFFRQRLLGSV